MCLIVLQIDCIRRPINLRKISNDDLSIKYKIMILDDDESIIFSLSPTFKKLGYYFVGITNPNEGLEILKNEHFDILIVDFLMEPIHGDKVVEEIRKFDNNLYILFLTGHKNLAPPIETIRTLDIQGYCDKSDKFDQLILLIESAFKYINQTRIIRRFSDGLSTILNVLPRIYQSNTIHEMMKEILACITKIFGYKDVFILIDNIHQYDNLNNIFYKGAGIYEKEIKDFLSLFGHETMEKIGYAKTNKVIVEYKNSLVVPLTNEYKNTLGVIIIYIQSNETNENMKLLEIFVNQVAAAINNIFLHSLVSLKEDELKRKDNDLSNNYFETIQALRRTVDARDIYTRGHSDRVAFYSKKIGETFNLSSKQIKLLEVGGTFHDIGKIGIRDDIILKNQKLSEFEYDQIKQHPVRGANILSTVSMFEEIIPIVLCHHERIDGLGYPNGLKNEEIPMLARIIAVADSFDAMTSDRLYRSKLSLKEAINQLRIGAGTQFDKAVTDKFIELLKDYEKMYNEISNTFSAIY